MPNEAATAKDAQVVLIRILPRCVPDAHQEQLSRALRHHPQDGSKRAMLAQRLLPGQVGLLAQRKLCGQPELR